MEIRNMEINDIQNVIELLENSKPYVLPHHHYVYWIMQEYFLSTNIIALHQGKIVGYICGLLSTEKDCIFIWQIAVDRAYKRRGIGSRLLSELVTYSEKNHIKSLQFSIDKSNNSSYELFLQLARKLNKKMERIGSYNTGDMNDIVCRIDIY